MWLVVVIASILAFGAVGASAVGLFRSARALLRELADSGEELTVAVDRLGRTLDRTTRHAAAVGDTRTLQESLDRLGRSRARLHVLGSAWSEARDAWGRLAAVAPRK